MKKILLSVTCCFTVLSSIVGQDSLLNKNPYSIEFEIHQGKGAGRIGLAGKINYPWLNKGAFKVQSGILISSYASSNHISKKDYSVSSFTSDNHLQLHTGIEQSLFKKKRIYLFTELYAGGYNVFRKGNLKNSVLSIDREYKNNEFLLDYGSRLGIGYRIKDKWGIQLSLTNSWRQINNGIGVIPSLLLGEADNKMSIGLGINYQF